MSTVPVRARIEAAFTEKLAESRRLVGGVCEQAKGNGYCCSYHEGFEDALDIGLFSVLAVLGVEDE